MVPSNDGLDKLSFEFPYTWPLKSSANQRKPLGYGPANIMFSETAS